MPVSVRIVVTRYIAGLISESALKIWNHPTPFPTLSADQVHIWRASLEIQEARRKSFWDVLSNDEQARADRYKFDTHRFWFIARSAFLREIVAGYLRCPPAEIAFEHNRYGKPVLLDHSTTDRIEFNLSHSAGIALFAFVWNRPIGVDVEHMRDNFNYLKLAARFFSAVEVAALNALPNDERMKGFFLCWTRKEAFIKAHGEGLSLPLDSFDVSLAPGEKACLLATRGELEAADDWTMEDIPLAPDFAGALVVHGKNLRLAYFQFANE
jgi:4'-phosphopantetheinyl transferase